MSSRNMRLLPRATLRRDREQYGYKHTHGSETVYLRKFYTESEKS